MFSPSIRLMQHARLLSLLLAGLTAACSSDSYREKSLVRAVAETQAVASGDDAADDPAIWIHPQASGRSLVIGADKRRGLEVYDLDGRRVQSLARGRLNNVDIRQGVRWGEAIIDLAVASNRTSIALDLFMIDPTTGRLSVLSEAGVPLEMDDPYGLCLYHDAQQGRLYAFVNDTDGNYQQWLLKPASEGGAELSRRFKLATQPEGCVADDEQHILYFGEEEYGVWQVDARATAPYQPVLIDQVGNARLTADVEGIALYRTDATRGYLIVSSQGDDSYAVYRREAGNEFVGSFRVADNRQKNVDGTSETDGLAVTSVALNENYPEGLLVVQDDNNTGPQENQNFKFISWADITAILY